MDVPESSFEYGFTTLITRTRDRLKGVYYGWWVLVSTFCLGALSGGLLSHSSTIYFGHVKNDLGISHTQASLIFSLSRAEGSITGPIVGILIDRMGARPLIIVGGLLASLGFILLHWTHNYWMFVLIYVGIASTGRNAGLSHALMSTVNRWFNRKRPLAMSICVTGFSAGGAFLLPLVAFSVNTQGWRDAMLYSGIFIGLIVVPLGLIVRHSPERMGINIDGLPDNDKSLHEGNRPKTRTRRNVDYSVREAVLTKTFWILFLPTLIRTSLFSSITIHAVQIMIWKGMEPRTADFMVFLLFLFMIPTRILAGILGQRFPLQFLLSGGIAASVLGLLAILLFEGNFAIYSFIILTAIGQGGAILAWVALGDYFGRKNFGTIMGIMSTCFNIGMFLSPLYAGWVFDLTQSYKWVLITFAPLLTLSSIFYLFLREPGNSLMETGTHNEPL